MFKKIWRVVLNVVIVIGMIVLLAFFLIKNSVRSTGPTLEERMNSREWKAKEAFDGYAIYNSNRNIQVGTTHISYFPCPKGYDCEKIVPDSFKIVDKEIVFDHCETAECIAVLRDLLYAYDIDNIDEYLAARRISANYDSQNMSGKPKGE